MQYLFEVVTWLFTIEIIGFIALPITAYLCGALPDRGYAVSKIMGLLLLTYFSWILPYSGLGYSTSIVFASLFLLVMVSYTFYKKFGLTIDKSFVIKNELFFIGVFFIFLTIRSFSPDNYLGLDEKFMDMTFINSILRSSTFPPTDPWFSGMPMNYYYFGYLLIADLVKLTDTVLPVGFNIASAIFFALSASAAFGIGFALVKKVTFGLITFAFVLLFGNMIGFMQLLVILFFPNYYDWFYVPNADLLTRLSTFSQLPSVKIMPGGFGEVPYQVYLIGDLHPNLVSISFQMLILAALLSIIIARKITYLQAALLGLIVGFLYPLNTWDYPAYIAITVAVVFLTTKDKKNSILLSGLIVVSSFFFYLPYHLSYQKVHKIAVIFSGRTELIYFLSMYGVFIFMILYFVKNNNQLKQKSLLILFIGAILLPLALIIKFQLLILLVPLVFLSYLGIAKDNIPEKQFICLLILFGALLSLFAELFYIQDTFDKSVYFRYNTVFKLYSQIWILWGIAASYAFYEMLKKKIVYVACFLILMAMIFPVFVTLSQSSGFNVASTLDAERSIKKEHPFEYESIEWLRSKNGTPVVLQAAGFSYAWNSYVSAFTGLPTVLGWEWHEYQWRMNLEEINIRRSDVERAYTSPDYEEIKTIIEKYDLKYIYVGPVERDRYKITNVFEQEKGKFNTVFKNPEVEIYEVQ